MKLNRNQKILIIVGLVLIILLSNGGFNLSLINIQKIWPVEKYFDNPWATNNGSPRILQAIQYQNSVSETSRSIVIPDTNLVIGSRIEYYISYIDGGVNSPDASIDFNGVNVAKVRFLSHGQVITGTANVAHDLLRENNEITISHTNAWGGWSKVSYDVILVLGYDIDPIDDPDQGGGGGGGLDDLWGWLNSYTYAFNIKIPNYIFVAVAFLLLVLGRR